MSEYKERDIEGMDVEGNYFCKHMSAMTGEDLHSKAAIAAELGYRDMRIDELTKALVDTNDCTLQAINEVKQLKPAYEILQMSRDHKVQLLESCEKALSESDERVLKLVDAIRDFEKNPITENKFKMFDLIK